MMTDLSALAGLSLEQIERELGELVEHKRYNKIEFWVPFQKQREFFALGKFKKQRMLSAGNQFGKCFCFNTLIDHADGRSSTVGALYASALPFDVLAWDGDGLVPAIVSEMYKLPPEPCVRIWFRNGRTVDVAVRHRMLGRAGQYLFVSRFLEGLPCLPPTSLAPGRQVRAQGARRCWRTVRDFLARCSPGFHRRDAQPLWTVASGPAWLPSQGDAPRHSLPWSPSDAAVLPCDANNGRSVPGRLSSWGAQAHSLGRSAAFLARVAYTNAPRRRWTPQAVARPLAASASLLRSGRAVAFGRWLMPTLFDPLGDGNAIVAYKRIASQPVYDFTVPAHANYLTAGVIHHNSTAGGAEAACHATGLYPKDWVGHRYKTPTDGWAAGETTETVRNIIQEQLCGKAGSDETFGTGFIPRRCFVGKPTMQRNAGSDTYDTVRVRWTGAGGRLDESAISTIQFKNYAQGAKRFQGPTRHWVWKDEEPPADVDTECEARYSAIPDGRSWMTFTPLGGYTSVVSRFFEDDDEGAADRGLTIITVDDVLAAGLWTPEMVAAAKRKYDAHEWPARLYGEPKQGIGRVFTTDENLILYPRSLQIAPHWGLLWGIDFGLGHPFAAVLAAIDREADVIYLMHTHRAADTHPLIHAEAIRRIGANVPVAWPRDGHNRQTGEADLTAAKDLYKKLDLKMLPHHATFPDGSISTEAAVLEMQQRFADGRLRVHEDLTDFREEYRGYHRKLDKSGNSIIVKLRDDLISCVLKIVMMKRHARAVKLGWVARPVKEDNEPVRLPIRDPWTGRIVHRFDDNTRWH